MQNAIQDFYQKLSALHAMASSPQDIEQWLVMTISQTRTCCGRADDVQIAATRELGILYRRTGQYPAALSFLNQAAQLSAETYGSESSEFISAQLHLGAAYRDAKDTQSSQRCLQAAWELCGKRTDAVLLRSALLRELALINAELGCRSTAIQQLEKSIQLAAEAGCPGEAVKTCAMLAGLCLRAGDLDGAHAATEEATRLSKAEEVAPAVRAEALNSRGVVAFQERDFPAAADAFASELALLSADGPTVKCDALYLYLSQCVENTDNLPAAKVYLEQGCAVFSDTLGRGHPAAQKAAEALLRLQTRMQNSAQIGEEHVRTSTPAAQDELGADCRITSPVSAAQGSAAC